MRGQRPPTLYTANENFLPLLLCSLVLCVQQLIVPAHAASVKVSTCDQLASAIASTFDPIIIPSGKTIDVNTCQGGTGLPSIQRKVTIRGETGAAVTPIVTGKSKKTIFKVNINSNPFTVTFSDLVIRDGKKEDNYNAGCIHVGDGTISLALSSVSLVGCFSTTGGSGAVYLGGGKLSISNSVFANNSATTTSGSLYGGAILSYSSSYSVSVSSSQFLNNSLLLTTPAGSGDVAVGGAIWTDGNFTVSNSYFGHNWAKAVDANQASGGAIHSDGYQLNIQICDFEFNSVESKGGRALGGAIEAYYTNVDSSLFNYNTAKTSASKIPTSYSDQVDCSGGAIRLTNDGSINNSTFTFNSVNAGLVGTADGGAFYLDSYSSFLPITLSNFHNNQAIGIQTRGGAVFTQSQFSSESNSFVSNSAKVSLVSDPNYASFTIGAATGGAIISTLSDYSYSHNIRNCAFSKNSAEGFATASGGAIALQTSVYSKSTTFFKNSVSIVNANSKNPQPAYGGAIFDSCSPCNVTINDCVFDSNSVQHTLTDGGGGAFGSDWTPNLSVISSSFNKNKANSRCKSSTNACDYQKGGGGAVYSGGEISISGSVFTNNSHYSTLGANAYSCGGAICSPFANRGYFFSLSYSSFASNIANSTTAKSVGGAVSASPATSLVVQSVSFASNIANGYVSYGGALHSSADATNISSSIFMNNVVSSFTDTRGGAVDLSEVTNNGWLVNSTFTLNSALSKGGNAKGGAVSFAASEESNSYDVSLYLSHSSFLNNSAKSSKALAFAGALYLGFGRADLLSLVSYSSFEGNEITSGKPNGGAIFVEHDRIMSFCKGNSFATKYKNTKNDTSFLPSKLTKNDLDSGGLNQVHFCPDVPLYADDKSLFTPVLVCDLCDCSTYFNPCDKAAKCSLLPSSPSYVVCQCPRSKFKNGNGFKCF